MWIYYGFLKMLPMEFISYICIVMKDISKLSASEYFYNALAVRKSAMEDIIS